MSNQLLARSRPLPLPVAPSAAAAARRRQQRRSRAACRSLPLLHLASAPVADSSDQQQHSHDAAPAEWGLLQLRQLTTPAALRDAWQAQLAPECASAWQQLHQLLQWQAADAEQQAGTAAAADAQPGVDGTAAHAQQQWPLAFLHQLDELLGDLQQAALVAGLLKDQHSSQEWRTAATAVFVSVREMEQQVCSDTLLQQGLLLARGQLQQQLAGDSSSSSSSSSSRQQLRRELQLARVLQKHMQLEGLSPGGFGGLPPAAGDSSSSSNSSRRGRDAAATFSVLTLQQQRALLSGLQAQARVVANKAQDVLLDPAAAPVVELDAESRQVLLAPLQQQQAADAAYAAAAGAAEEAGCDQLALGLPFVTALLQQHPDAAVRADVYAAGLLQRLDVLLQQWAALAEARRKVARDQGCPSYAHLVLQHSLLGSADAASTFCEQLAHVLAPGAAAELRQLAAAVAGKHGSMPPGAKRQRQPQQLAGADLAYAQHLAQLEALSHEELQQVQPYLSLDGVMTGFDRLLQQLLGLALARRQPHPGELWCERLQVWELRELQQCSTLTCAGSSMQQQQQQATEETEAASVIGTIYLDPAGGFSTQQLLYRSGCSSSSSDSSNGSGSSGNGSSSAWAQHGSGGVPAVAVGLQSGGNLGANHATLALGLWELCHELGHALHFLLSTAPSSSSSSGSDHSGGSRDGSARAPYHAHAAWLPLELLELPSTLFEALCMAPATLQLLCRHASSSEALPQALAGRLAAFMRRVHRSPLSQQHVVLAMLFDLQLAAADSKLLGRHPAHSLWGRVVQCDELSAMPAVEVSLQQAASLPRLLASCGQGYGYAVAWCLAQLLEPALLRHAVISSVAADPDAAADGQCLWRRFLASGTELADVQVLAGLLVELLQHGGEGASELQDALGQLPQSDDEHSAQVDVLAVLLRTALLSMAENAAWFVGF